jgi:maltoporin
MKRNALWLLGAVTLGGTPALAQSDLEANFYFRTGLSASRAGSDGVCFSSPGWPDIHPRFGNECGNYGEIALRKSYKPKAQDSKAPWYQGQLTFAVTANGHQSDETVKPEKDESGNATENYDLSLANKEIFVEAMNYVGEGSKLWVGKRYYDRIYIPMWDFFMLNNSGSGTGIADIPLATGKLALALMRHQNSSTVAQPFHTNLDLRYSLPLADSSLQLVAIAGEQGTTDPRSAEEKWQKVSGESLTLFWENKERPYQYKVVLQHGRGLYGARPDHDAGGWSTGSLISRFEEKAFSENNPTNATKAEAWQNSSSSRALANLMWAPDAPYWIDMSAFFGMADFGGRKDDAGEVLPVRKTYAVGVKPAYMFNEHHSVETDLYWSLIKDGHPYADYNYKGTVGRKPIDRELHKLTLAYVLRPLPEDWARPVIRFYATVARWNDETKGDNFVSGYPLRPVYKNETTGYTLGVMADVWL